MVRPLKPADERRSYVLQVRWTEAERERLEDGAARAGVQLAEFIRSAALEKADKQPTKVRKPSKK